VARQYFRVMTTGEWADVNETNRIAASPHKWETVDGSHARGEVVYLFGVDTSLADLIAAAKGLCDRQDSAHLVRVLFPTRYDPGLFARDAGSDWRTAWVHEGDIRRDADVRIEHIAMFSCGHFLEV
jgi:hypothetical protein